MAKKAVKKSNQNKKPSAPPDPPDRAVLRDAWVAFCESVGLGCPMAFDLLEFSCAVGLLGKVRMDVKYSECSVRGPDLR